MSVYSGFATRKQEAFYNKLVAKLLYLFTQKALSSIPYSDIGPFLTGGQLSDAGANGDNRSGERVTNTTQDDLYSNSIDADLLSLARGCGEESEVRSNLTVGNTAD